MNAFKITLLATALLAATPLVARAESTFTSGAGPLTATAPATLSNGAGDTVAFSQISWTSSGNGNTGTQPIPAGNFASAVQTLGVFPVNRWNESCHSFSYANDAVVAAGTYTGTVTYTLSTP